VSRTIWKFTLKVGRWETISLPPAAKVIFAAIDPQSGAPAIWVDLDVDDMGCKDRLFAVFGTGREIDDDAIHRGSMLDGSFVWHVFERPA
jgi:Tfp pilus tip-associated adhesin PilY1